MKKETEKDWTAELYTDGVPTGAIMIWTLDAIPRGWLLCDGAQYTRQQYPQLCSLLAGTSDTFNVPDYRGMFLRGHDRGRTIDDGRELGSIQAGSIHAINVERSIEENYRLKFLPPVHGIDVNQTDEINRETMRNMLKIANYDQPNFITSGKEFYKNNKATVAQSWAWLDEKSKEYAYNPENHVVSDNNKAYNTELYETWINRYMATRDQPDNITHMFGFSRPVNIAVNYIIKA